MKVKKILFIMTLICMVCASFPTVALAESYDWIVEEADAHFIIGQDNVGLTIDYTITNGSSADISEVSFKIQSPDNLVSQGVSFVNATDGKELSGTKQDAEYLLKFDHPLAGGESITITISDTLNYKDTYEHNLAITFPAISGLVKMPQTKDSFTLTVKLPEDWSISSSFPTVYSSDKDSNEFSVSLDNIPGLFQAKLLTEPGGIKGDTLLNIAFPSLLLIGAGVAITLMRVQIKHRKLKDERGEE